MKDGHLNWCNQDLVANTVKRQFKKMTVYLGFTILFLLANPVKDLLEFINNKKGLFYPVND